MKEATKQPSEDTMTNMIEKAARAAARDWIESEPLYTLSTNTIDEEVDLIWPEYVPEARAVLTAIREPNEAMINAKFDLYTSATIEDHWRNMIDAILKEGT